MDIHYLPVTERDIRFLFDVFCSSRIDGLKHTQWSMREKINFLISQFQLQHRHYTYHYKDAFFLKIKFQKKDIGRLYLHRGSNEIRLMDIALLPDAQNKRVGTSILETLKKEASGKNVPLTLHVDSCSRAVQFYKRLGFETLSTHGPTSFMRWMPESRGRHNL
ncbi:MAG: GNAT family N-acetyltransferase [Deltaproteobacteria bacterium]|nr:GNAT family N-acetyltransferase [Deltaproteobacteria bacterium]